MHSGLLLIALGFGFKIFAEASSNNKKRLRQLGQLIGVFIMVTSFLGTLCTVSYAIQSGKLCPMGKGWGYGGKMCPIMGKSMSDMTAQSKSN